MRERRKRPRKRRRESPPAADLWPEDRVDPRIWIRKEAGDRARGRGRKTLALCRQVRDTVSLALPAELGLAVASVAPWPDGKRLLVLLAPEDPASPPDEEALDRLDALLGWLRSEVASSITRRRAPELVFRVVGPSG